MSEVPWLLAGAALEADFHRVQLHRQLHEQYCNLSSIRDRLEGYRTKLHAHQDAMKSSLFATIAPVADAMYPKLAGAVSKVNA